MKNIKKLSGRYYGFMAAGILIGVLCCTSAFASETTCGLLENSDNKGLTSKDKSLASFASAGDSRFPVTASGKKSTLNLHQKKYYDSMKSASLPRNIPKGRFSTAQLSSERFRNAYTAGYGRNPSSYSSRVPRRMTSLQSEMTRPEWAEKYRKNSFAGSRPVPAEYKSTFAKSAPSQTAYLPSDRNVRVLLKKTGGSVSIEATACILVSENEGNISVTRIKGKTAVDAQDGFIFADGKKTGEKLCQMKPSAGSIKVDGKSYRGYLSIHADSSSLVVVNHLPMESYLMGVVPSEMPSGWDEEALKAQAVASRSYALFHMQERSARLWDLDRTEADQVYGGMDAEDARATLAVYATKGQVMIYGGHPVEALFHADNGGYMESPGTVWKKDYPYLKSMSDRFTVAGGPYKWEYFISSSQFFSRLRGAGIYADKDDDVRIAEKTKSGRVEQVAVGDSLVAGSRLRKLLNPSEMKSTKYDVKEKDGGFLFSGLGYGHGVGMSQNGAKHMAGMGYSYQSILRFYYKGVSLADMAPAIYAGMDNAARNKELFQ